MSLGGRVVTWHLVTPEAPPRIGGIATWSDRVARALQDAGETVVVYARGPVAQRPWPTRAMPGRSWRRHGGLWALLAVGPRLRRGDVLLCATWEMAHGPFGGLLARADAIDVPVIVAWHGSDLTRPAVREGRGAVARRARNVAVSRFLAARLFAQHGAVASVLPSPVDVLPAVSRERRWLVVARLVPSKGVDLAIRAALRHARPLTVVGDGPERPVLEALARDLGAEVCFLGALPPEDIPWEGHEAVLLTPRPSPDGDGEEGLGLVLLEGAARGVIPVGAACGGVPEVAAVLIDRGHLDLEVQNLSPASVQSWLSEHHGSRRCVEELRARVAETA